jgi:hypothetical protein
VSVGGVRDRLRVGASELGRRALEPNQRAAAAIERRGVPVVGDEAKAFKMSVVRVGTRSNVYMYIEIETGAERHRGAQRNEANLATGVGLPELPEFPEFLFQVLARVVACCGGGGGLRLDDPQ